MADPLEGARLKVERAKRHIVEGSEIIRAFLATNPYTIVKEQDLVKGIESCKIIAIQQPPLEIAVICGEVLYALRSALDHIVTATATRNGHVIIGNTGFPIEPTRKKFEATLHERKIEQRLPELAEVLRELQPYKGGNDLLWWLQRLNGAEKHKTVVLIPGAAAAHEHAWNADPMPGTDFTDGYDLDFKIGWQRVDKDAVLVQYPIGIKFQSNTKLFCNVVFGDIESAEPWPVTDTLEQFSDLVFGIITIFRTRFFV